MNDMTVFWPAYWSGFVSGFIAAFGVSAVGTLVFGGLLFFRREAAPDKIEPRDWSAEERDEHEGACV